MSIKTVYSIDFDWQANYIDKKTLSLTINSHTVLQGNEKIFVRFINYKVWRGPNGGCLTKLELTSTMQSSLESSVSKAETMSVLTKYSSIIWIFLNIFLIVIGGGSIEMMFALINAMQLISYLPLMTPFFPQHVRIMFIVFKFANMNFEFLSAVFK